MSLERVLRIFRICLVFILLLTVGIIVAHTESGFASEKHSGLPDLIPCTAYPVGTGGNIEASAIGAAFRRERNVTFRIIPGGSGIARLTPLKTGAVDFGFLGSELMMVMEGLDVFGRKDWGPRSMQMVWASFAPRCTLAVTKVSGIKVPADLKGKRITWVIGAAGLNRIMSGFLYFANLGLDDVKLVEVSGYGASVASLKEGRADVCFANPYNPKFEELAATPYGLIFIQTPHDDKAGWERFLSILPWFNKNTITRSVAGLFTEKNPGEVVGGSYPIVATRSDKDPDYVYAMAKAIHEIYPRYKDVTHTMTGWHVDQLKNNITAFPGPMHEGAVRYFKEIGIWTQAAETHNKKMLYRNKLLSATWKEAISAKGERLKGKEWEGFWLEKRREALEKEGLATYELPAKLIP